MAELLEGFFKGKQDPRVVVDGGGVWNGKTRIAQLSAKVEAQETLTVFVFASPPQRFRLDSSLIVLEHADWLIVNKPAELATVSDHTTLHWNLTAGVNDYLSSQGSGYPSCAINRLDKGVSGLVLFPKHKKAERALFAMMREHRIAKAYVAVLQAHPQKSVLRVSDCLIFDKKAAVHPSGKPAQSVFLWRKTVSEGEEYRVVIRTGKRHQIRVHASHYLAPIVGDRLYGPKRQPSRVLKLVADKQKFWWEGTLYKVTIPTHNG